MPLNKPFLLDLLETPTAPYRETLVIEKLKKYLSDFSVPHFSDPHGNIVVGVANQNEYLEKVKLSTQEPLRVFIAHMDHPGFHGESWDKKGRLKISWHGGSPTQYLNGAKVWVGDHTGYLGVGKFESVKLHSSKLWIQSADVSGLNKDLLKKDPKTLFGAFSFKKPVWKKKSLYYTKAADDLVGCFAIVSLAETLFKEKKESSKNFIGLLTRAEEVGFIGAIAHFNLPWLKERKREILGVSLETSRTLPGALIGKGPVVRLGDRASVFDAKALEVLSLIAKEKLPQKHQKRIMDGGTCEGTVVTLNNFPSVGISIPLGNYHNQNFEGGEGSMGKLGPAPEFVDEKDIEGMLKLCEGLMAEGLPWGDPWEKRRGEMLKRYEASKGML